MESTCDTTLRYYYLGQYPDIYFVHSVKQMTENYFQVTL